MRKEIGVTDCSHDIDVIRLGTVRTQHNVVFEIFLITLTGILQQHVTGPELHEVHVPVNVNIVHGISSS